LLRIMVPVLEDPKRVVAVGGIIRVLNGSEIGGGQLRRVRLPRKSIEAIQVIEYLRAFLIGREAWAQGNMLTIISGAFGVFRSDLVRAVGGYRSSSIGEDFDLVARLHRHLLEKGADYRIEFVPDPMCWTEVPSELFAPIIEIGGIFTIVLAASLGVLSRQFFLQFLLFGYAFATVISVGAVLQEEVTYKRYNDWQDVVRLVTYCFAEHFPYRQLHMIWRLLGLWQYLRGDVSWKPLKRQGLESTQI
jgi:hypothetical protein